MAEKNIKTFIRMLGAAISPNPPYTWSWCVNLKDCLAIFHIFTWIDLFLTYILIDQTWFCYFCRQPVCPRTTIQSNIDFVWYEALLFFILFSENAIRLRRVAGKFFDILFSYILAFVIKHCISFDKNYRRFQIAQRNFSPNNSTRQQRRD